MRRVAAIVLALPALAYGVMAVLYGLLVAAMQCDEICRTDGADWRYTEGAWQWYAIGSLGALTFAAGILFFAAVIARTAWRAIACLGLGTAAVVVAMTAFLVNPGSDQELPLALFWLVSGGVLVSGFLAVLLAGASTGTVGSPEFRLVASRVVAGLAFAAAAYFLLGGLSTLVGSTVGVPTAPLLGKAAVFAFIGWGFWRGGFRPRGRTG